MYSWLVWNVIFRAHEWVKGHDTYRYLAEMEAADRLPASGLEAYQASKLRAFIESCYANVPYVRERMLEAGVAPSDIAGPSDLRRLPLLTKADIRKHRQALRSTRAGRLSTFTTGGSTGEPLIFDLSKRRVAARVAARVRCTRWWGLTVGDRELALWGSPIEVSRQHWIRSLRDMLLSSVFLSAFEMSEERMSQYLDILEKGRFRQLFGYPSAIYLLVLHARKQGRDLRKLGVCAVFVTAEVLMPHQRQAIAEAFNAPVANGYGGRDSGCIAHECPQGGMHVLSEGMILELLNARGEPVPPGEPGNVVVTDLYSEDAPFIRYVTGDVAVLSDRRCACGRVLPLLERVEGRSNDLIVTADGRLINSLALIYPVREVEGIEHFCVRQKQVDHFHMQLVRDDRYPADGEERIRTAWSRLLRTPVQVTFEYLPVIPHDPNGKFRHVISEVSGQSSGGDAAGVGQSSSLR